MRRTQIKVLAAISFAALVTSATSGLAMSPPGMHLGMLKPQDQWKVGTVNAQGANYCAMVGKFDKQVVLAFARNPDGFGSIAMDFRDTFFQPGEEYEVSLKTQGIKTRALVGRASSERSIVVQIGQDEQFYKALNNEGLLTIGMPTIDVAFALRKFNNSYHNLIACADGLEASPVQKAQEASLAPIDREVQKLSGEREQVEQASAEVAQLQESLQAKATGFDDMEDRLEQEAKAEDVASKTKLATLAQQQTDLKAQIAAQDAKTAALETVVAAASAPVKPVPANPVPVKAAVIAKTDTVTFGKAAKVAAVEAAAIEPAAGDATADAPSHASATTSSGRTLLASIGGSANVPPSEGGSEARQIEQQEIAATAAAHADETARHDAQLSQQLAALEAQKTQDAQDQVAAFAKQKQAAADKAAQLQKDRDALAGRIAAKNTKDKVAKKLAAELSSKDKQLAKLTAAQGKQSAALTQNLAKTQQEYEDKIAALESERDSLKQTVAAQGSSLNDLQDQLASVEAAHADETARAQTAQKELASAKADLAGMKSSLKPEQTRLSELQDSLNAQQDALRKKESEQTAESGKLKAERAELASLRTDLEKGQQDVVATRERLAQVTSGKLSDDAALKIMKADIEKREARLKEQASAQAEQAKKIDADKKRLAADTSAAEMVAAEKTELASLRTRVKDMEKQLKDSKARVAAQESDYQSSRAVAAAGNAANVAELEQRTGDLEKRESKLASDRAAFENEKATLASAGADPHALADAKVEIGRLQQENTSLLSRLTAALTPSKSAPKTAGLTARDMDTAAQAKVASSTGDTTIYWQTDDSTAANTAGRVKLAGMGATDNTAQQLNNTQPAAGDDDASDDQSSNAAMLPLPDSSDDMGMPVTPADALAPARDASAQGTAPVVVAAKTEKGGLFSRMLGGYHVPEQTASSNNFKVPAVPTTPVATESVADLGAASKVKTAAHDESLFSKTGDSVKAVKVASVTAPESPNEITAADANKAAAFLDQIMSYHKTGDSEALDNAAELAATSSADVASGVGRAVKTPTVESADLVAVKQVTSTAKIATLNAASYTAPVRSEDLARIETAAGNPAPFEAQPAHTDVLSSAPAVKTAAIPAAAPVIAAVSGPVTIDALLQTSGVTHAAFQSADAQQGEVVRQWTTGSINGMYEKTASTSGAFETEMQNYIDRYRDDCPGKLAVSIGAAEKTAAGPVAIADITCEMPQNAYTASMVFLENADGFQTVLHTGYPKDATQVRSISDNLSSALEHTQGILAPAPVVKAEAVIPAYAAVSQQPAALPIMAAPVQRFRIGIKAPADALPPEAATEFPTVVVQ